MNAKKIVNLTPRVLIIVRADGEKFGFLPSRHVAYVREEREPVGELAGFSLVRTTLGEIEGLPEPQEGVVYVTSPLVAQVAALRGRRDVVAPDTSPASAVKNEFGHIVAVRRLQTFVL